MINTASIQQLIQNLEQFSGQTQDVSPLNASSLLLFKIKKLYEEEKRKKKQKHVQNKTQIFYLNRKQQKKSYNHIAVDNYSRNLISYHLQNNVMQLQEIKSLIKILNLIYKFSNLENLEQCILKKISELKNIQDIFSGFITLFYSPYYLKNSCQVYKLVEKKMIKILLGINFQNYNPDLIMKFTLSLPYLGQSTLQLLSHFLEEMQQSKAAEQMYQCFMKYFPQKPSEEQIKYLIKISNTKAIEEIINLAKQNYLSHQVLEQEAKLKLKKIPNQVNERGKSMLVFIFFVAAHGGAIWAEIIEWEKSASKQYKNEFKSKAHQIIGDTMNFQYLLVILLKLTNINHESQIAEQFFNHVISKKDKQILNTIIVKKFLASKLIFKLTILRAKEISFASSPLAIIFSQDLSYVDILLQLFNKQNDSYNFYSYFLDSNQQNLQMFMNFLNRLYKKKKSKFKEFFLNVMHTSEGNLFVVNQHKLLLFFLDKLDLELSYVIIKQMSTRAPTKYYMLFMIHCIRKFNQKEIRTAIIRNINIILTRLDFEIIRQFSVDFIKFYESLNAQQKNRIYSDVPKSRRETIEAMSTMPTTY